MYWNGMYGCAADHSRGPNVLYSLCAVSVRQLIAPDIILTAAHCFISNYTVGTALLGVYNLTSREKDSEIHIFQEVVTHPHYYDPLNQAVFSDEHDYALCKIYDTAKVGSPIKLNKDASVPDSTPDVPLHVLGWGRTNASDPALFSNVLKEADVSFIPNEVCKNVNEVDHGFLFDYENMVFDITLCAGDFQQGDDTCGGDSGGPILLAGQSADDDVQLGVTSYGAIQCGHPNIPAVYARVSYVYDWIRDNVCRMSLDPPADFECETPAFSTEPDLSGEMVDLALEFVADAYANEVGWIIQSPNESGVMVTYAYEPVGTYPKGTAASDIFNLKTTVSLPNNRQYVLTMFDGYGDGFTGGDFVAKLYTADATILDEAVPFKNYTLAFDFVLGTLPTASPTATPAPTLTLPPSMAPTVTPPLVWVVINFDDRPGETGWRIEVLYENGDTETLQEVFPGTYEDMASTSEPFLLLPETPMTYRFTLTDNEADGICCDFGQGSYELWLGDTGSAGLVLAKGQDLVWEISHEFVVERTLNGSYTSPTGTSSAVSCRSMYAAFFCAVVSLLVF